MAITITRYSNSSRTCRVNYHGRKTFEISFDEGVGDNITAMKMMGIYRLLNKMTAHYSVRDIQAMSKALGQAVETHGHRGCSLKEAVDKHFS